jgi:hypothetical protein
MNRLTVAVLGAGLLCSGLAVRSGLAQGAARAPDGGVVRGGAQGAAQAQDRRLAEAGAAPAAGPEGPASISFQEQNALIGRFCLRCHNDAMRTGGLSLESFDAARAHERAEVAEKMILKLQAGMMPPATAQRPDAATYASLVASLSRTLDEAAAASSGSTVPSTRARSRSCSACGSTPRRSCRRTRSAPASTTSPTRRGCRQL